MTHRPLDRSWHITAAPTTVLAAALPYPNSLKPAFTLPPASWPMLPTYGAEACADALRRLRPHPPIDRAHVHNAFDLPEPSHSPANTNGSTPTQELIMLVDTGTSMSAWYPTVDRLRVCALALESFVDVHIRKLVPPAPNAPRVDASAWQGLDLHKRTTHQHRKIVFVVTDGVGALWHRGLLWEEMQRWAKYHTLAMLIVLPHEHWRRSALSTRSCQLKAPRPVCANSALIEVHPQEAAPAAQGAEEEASDSAASAHLPIPVLELHREWLGKWIHLMTSGIPVQQHILQPPPGPQQAQQSSSAPAGDDAATHKVANFRTSTVKNAWDLAVALAAAPLNRHLMQAIAAEMLPWSTPHDLAAIFTSGLLVNLGPDLVHRDQFDEVVFDFSPGVRQTLLGQGDMSQTHEVIRLLDKHLGPHVDAVRGVTERLHNPSAARFPAIDDTTLPYLRIECDVLATFGMASASPHRQASENLAKRIQEYEANRPQTS